VDYGQPSSYLALEAGTDVYSSEGERIGKVEHVLAVPEEDIFDGLVIELDGALHFCDAPEVGEIYDNGVVLKLSAAEAAQLPKPSASPAVMESGADMDSRFHDKMRRAWDRISGNY
jgi:hypothetical protein